MDQNTECKHEAGVLRPVIDRNRCEGKGDCERVCPEAVFTIGKLPAGLRVGLSLMGKIKGFAHQWQQALLIDVEACRACGLCVTACPGAAITLRRA